jgi:hypothetical protein
MLSFLFFIILHIEYIQLYKRKMIDNLKKKKKSQKDLEKIIHRGGGFLLGGRGRFFFKPVADVLNVAPEYRRRLLDVAP